MGLATKMVVDELTMGVGEVMDSDNSLSSLDSLDPLLHLRQGNCCWSRCPKRMSSCNIWSVSICDFGDHCGVDVFGIGTFSFSHSLPKFSKKLCFQHSLA